MTFADFLAQAFNWGALSLFGTALLGVALLAGSFLAAVFGGLYLADNYDWRWNLLYIPAVAAAGGLGLLFALWLGMEVAL